MTFKTLAKLPLWAALAFVASTPVQAADQDWQEGTHYFRIDPVQSKVSDTDKIEVAEVFSFVCPACNHAHPYIDKMRKALPDDATMAYLPASFRPDENWPVYQQAWLTAEALGIANDDSYDASFDATWKSGEIASYNLDTGKPNPQSKWPKIDDLATWYSDNFDVSKDEFEEVADSFAVKTQMKRADNLIKSYGVMSTPTIIVNGKYRFDFQSAGGYDQGIELAQWLVKKIEDED